MQHDAAAGSHRRRFAAVCVAVTVAIAIVSWTGSHDLASSHALLETRERDSKDLTVLAAIPSVARSGDVLEVDVPGQGLHDVQVPTDAIPGEILSFHVPSLRSSEQLRQSSALRVLVTVPPAAQQGDILQVAVPGHGLRKVLVPAGVKPGQVLRFSMLASGRKSPERRSEATVPVDVTIPVALRSAISKLASGQKLASETGKESVVQFLQQSPARLQQLAEAWRLPSMLTSDTTPSNSTSSTSTSNATQDEYAPLIAGRRS